MDDKHIIFESTVVGLIVLAFTWPVFYVINDAEAMQAMRLLVVPNSTKETGVSEVIARLVVLGVALSSLGLIVRVASIVLYQEKHGKDPYRKAFAAAIKDEVKWCSAIDCPIKSGITNASDDALFVWAQYSDPQEALREWGRTRRRYMYVGENWKTAMHLGLGLGLVSGLVSRLDHLGSPNCCRLLVALAVLFGFLVAKYGLNRLIDHNRREEQSMVAVYVAGIRSNRLRKEFLKPKFRGHHT